MRAKYTALPWGVVSFAAVVWARHATLPPWWGRERFVTSPNNGCEGDYLRCRLIFNSKWEGTKCRVAQLYRFLVARGYKQDFIPKQFNKCNWKLERMHWYHAQWQSTYGCHLPSWFREHGGFLRELESFLLTSEENKQTNKQHINQSVFRAFTWLIKLEDYLVHVKLVSQCSKQFRRGRKQCGVEHCQMCKHLKLGDRFNYHRTTNILYYHSNTVYLIKLLNILHRLSGTNGTCSLNNNQVYIAFQ